MNEAAFVALREENERLSAENAFLRGLYCADPTVEFIETVRHQLQVMPQVAKLLWTLWDCRPKSREAIAYALWGDHAEEREIKNIDVQMCRLRSALSGIGAGIQTNWGTGFHLLPAQRERIAAELGIEIQP